MSKEIERKWLLSGQPDLFLCCKNEILQGYISDNPTEVRLRQVTPESKLEPVEYYLTIKKPGTALTREETEVEITEQQYEVLSQAVIKSFTKTLYEYELYTSERYLEVSHIEENGLILAEVEFESEAEAALFSPEEFQSVLIKEVTGVSDYKSVAFAKPIMRKLTEVTASLVKEIPGKSEMEYGRVYVSPEYGTCSFLCPCGCGDEVAISINKDIWGTDVSCWEHSFTGNPDNGIVTLSPSILQRGGCKSHFFIRNNKVEWC